MYHEERRRFDLFEFATGCETRFKSTQQALRQVVVRGLTERLDHGLRNVGVADDIANGAHAIALGCSACGCDLITVEVRGLAPFVDDGELAPASRWIVRRERCDHLLSRLTCSQ